MYGILIFFHLLISVVLVLVVLVQQPQKGGMASIMGGGESVFGGSGAAPFMAKVTTGLAIAFMVTSLGLVLVAARLTRSNSAPRPTPAQPMPAQPAQSEPGPLGD